MNASTEPAIAVKNPDWNYRGAAGSLAPLAEILGARFHIDVSQDDALLVQTESGTEFPLSLLSGSHSDEIREKACDQYVQSVLSGAETIEQDRATLFFISRFCDKNSRVVLVNGATRKNRPASRRARKRSFESGGAQTTLCIS